MWTEITKDTPDLLSKFYSIQETMNTAYTATMDPKNVLDLLANKEDCRAFYYEDGVNELTLIYKKSSVLDRYRMITGGVGKYTDMQKASVIFCTKIRDVMLEKKKNAYAIVSLTNLPKGKTFYDYMDTVMPSIGVSFKRGPATDTFYPVYFDIF